MTKGGHGGMGNGGVLKSRRRFPVSGHDSMRFKAFPVKPTVLRAAFRNKIRNFHNAFLNIYIELCLHKMLIKKLEIAKYFKLISG